MKNMLAALLLLWAQVGFAEIKDSTYLYKIPDSVKATQLLVDVTLNKPAEKSVSAGIHASFAGLYIRHSSKRGGQVELMWAGGKAESYWNFPLMAGKTYRLLLSMASDSAANTSIISGYIFLPGENKWKLVGTCKEIYNPFLQNLNLTAVHKKDSKFSISQVWYQGTGAWINLMGDSTVKPVINLYSHIDSIKQRETELKMIREAIRENKLDTRAEHNGIFYHIVKAGDGRQVSVEDTVTINYRLTLFSDGSLVDETKEKPATFPLKRLIKGWQIGVPLCKVGGKIKLVIPSDLGYSIRTRSAKIPPNSILVFEIEVVDAK
jgi:FKBP-type peptidyl-prolyl cis-trans isomerase FkpA